MVDKLNIYVRSESIYNDQVKEHVKFGLKKLRDIEVTWVDDPKLADIHIQPLKSFSYSDLMEHVSNDDRYSLQDKKSFLEQQIDWKKFARSTVGFIYDTKSFNNTVFISERQMQKEVSYALKEGLPIIYEVKLNPLMRNLKNILGMSGSDTRSREDVFERRLAVTTAHEILHTKAGGSEKHTNGGLMNYGFTGRSFSELES